jgi:hypothetical protein
LDQGKDFGQTPQKIKIREQSLERGIEAKSLFCKQGWGQERKRGRKVI